VPDETLGRLAEWAGLGPEFDSFPDAVKALAARLRFVEAERDKLLAALERCDVSMDTAAMLGLPQQLPQVYRDSWAAAHTAARAALARRAGGEKE
jgi:hypothetical protein